MAGSERQGPQDNARLTALLEALNIPPNVQDQSLRVRLEPLKRLQSDRAASNEPTFGLFVMWKPKSVLNGEADVTHLIDLPTCMTVRRACRARGIYVVDNTGLPALTAPSAPQAVRARPRKL